jgi:hypothetical protein
MRIQPKRSFEAVDMLLERTENPAHRVMLENFRAHMRAEISCDLDSIMNTMTAAPVYHSYGAPVDGGPKDREQTRAFYLSIFDAGSNVIELEVDRLSVDDWGIVGDGTIHIIYPGKGVSAMGFDIDDEDAQYLFSARQAFFLPYVDGLMNGEDTYIDWAGARVTKLDPTDVVTTEQALE